MLPVDELARADYGELGWASVPRCSEISECFSASMEEIFNPNFLWRDVKFRVFVSRAGRTSLLYSASFAENTNVAFECIGCSSNFFAALDQGLGYPEGDAWATFEADFPEKKLGKVNGSTFPDRKEEKHVGLDAGNIVAIPSLILHFEKKDEMRIPYCTGGRVGLRLEHESGTVLSPDELAHFLEALLDARQRVGTRELARERA